MKSKFFLFLCGMPLFSMAQKTPDLKINNLVSLAKLYGYVRYFYPGDEAAKMDYPRFTKFAVSKVEKAKNKAELKAILDSLFMPIAPGIKIYDESHPAKFSKKSLLPPKIDGIKTISWQHNGWGFGKMADESIYEEVRTNRLEKKDETFGNVMSGVKGAAYRGKKIRLRAAMKVDSPDQESNGHLWVRVDKLNNKIGFFENMDSRPAFSNSWKYYEIEGRVDNDAESIVFGCFLHGKGKLWVDDIHFSVQDEQKRWIQLDSLDGNFESTPIGRLPYWWYCPTKSYEAIVTGETAAVGSHSVRISLRETLFGPRTQVGDYVTKSLGNGLGLILPLALYGDADHTYPLPEKKSYYQLTGTVNNEISVFYEMSDPVVRVAAAISFWNVFQHFYPYFEEVKVDWEGALPRLLADAYEAKDEIDFMHILQKYQALLEDGHGHIAFTKDRYKRAILPIDWEWAEHKPVITNVFDKSTGLEKGDVVVEINGREVQTYLDSCMLYVSAATKDFRVRKTLMNLLTGDTGTVMALSVLGKSGKMRNLAIKRQLYSATTPSWEYGVNTDSIKKVESKIYYININNASSAQFNEMLPELTKAQSIVLDFRGYPNNMDLDFTSHFLSEALCSSHKRQNHSDYR